MLRLDALYQGSERGWERGSKPGSLRRSPPPSELGSDLDPAGDPAGRDLRITVFAPIGPHKNEKRGIYSSGWKVPPREARRAEMQLPLHQCSTPGCMPLTMTATSSPVVRDAERASRLPLSARGKVPVATTIVLFAVVGALLVFIAMVDS
jgi:hypothetical protein